MRIEVDVDCPGLDSFEAGHRARQAAVADRGRALMERFVPMSSGPSSGTLRGSTGGSDLGAGVISYRTPYANRQYRLHTANRTTPGTDGEWDEPMMASDGEALARFAGDLARRDLDGR